MRSYRKVLSLQIALAKDELVGQGLFIQQKATGDRLKQLEQQIEVWEALRMKLEGQGRIT